MKKTNALWLTLLLVVLAACSSPDAEPVPTESATAAAEVAVEDEPAPLPTETNVAAAETIAPPATVAPTGAATVASEATGEPTETASPTMAATETASASATPDIPGSWARLQADLLPRIPANCPLIESEPNIFLHIPGFIGEAGFCASYLAFGQGFMTVGYDPDLPLPGDREVNATIGLFQTNAADDQFMDLIGAINSGASTDGFSNYNVLQVQQVTANCSGSECNAPLERFLLAPEYTVACLTFTIRDPMHTAVICLIPSFSP